MPQIRAEDVTARNEFTNATTDRLKQMKLTLNPITKRLSLQPSSSPCESSWTDGVLGSRPAGIATLLGVAVASAIIGVMGGTLVSELRYR